MAKLAAHVLLWILLRVALLDTGPSDHGHRISTFSPLPWQAGVGPGPGALGPWSPPGHDAAYVPGLGGPIGPEQQATSGKAFSVQMPVPEAPSPVDFGPPSLPATATTGPETQASAEARASTDVGSDAGSEAPPLGPSLKATDFEGRGVEEEDVCVSGTPGGLAGTAPATFLPGTIASQSASALQTLARASSHRALSPPEPEGTFSPASWASSLAPGAVHLYADASINSSASSVHTLKDASAGNYSDECKFRSFEEWKRLKEADSHAAARESPRGSIGDPERISEQTANHSMALSQQVSKSPELALEDQGRVYKDKFNYASGDCAATIVKTNSDAKGASAILTEVKDLYLLNKCLAANKFVVIELCQDILVSSVVMGNFELFSLMFRTVKFSVSDRFPVTKGWHELGLFEAQNIRDMQTFDIDNPLIWARYLKIEIVSHYGNEFYCPISLVRVHGKTMMEEFKDTDLSAELGHTQPVPTPFADFIENPRIGEDEDNEQECKVRGPYLALNEFLRDWNSSADYCDVLLPSLNVSQTAVAETGQKPAQESIFQNIVKRLALLEQNATLSLLYVEEQSKLLSDAFFNLEQRQVRKFEHLLTHINETMYTQVLYLEQAVDKITVESRNLFRAQSSQALGSIDSLRVETVAFAREISFLRKVVAADTLIILAMLAFVFNTRKTVAVEDEAVIKLARPLLPAPGQHTIRPFQGHANRHKTRRRKR